MDERRSRFEVQVLAHLDAAYRYARWLARTPNDAEDVLQEATLRAFRKFEDLRGADGKAWFLTIVRNCHLTALRQAQRHNLVPLPDEHEAPAAALIDRGSDPALLAQHRDDEHTLQRLLLALPPDYREILVLRELADMAYREIASVTDLPIGTVMSRLARARAALREQWQQHLSGELHAMR